MGGAYLLVACSTHLGESLAFGVPPLVVIGALVIVAVRDRRRPSTEGLVAIDTSPGSPLTQNGAT